MNWARVLRAIIVRACLVLFGFGLAADLNPAAAATLVKCLSGQAYDAVTKKCSTAPAAVKPPVGAVKIAPVVVPKTTVSRTPKPGPPPPPTPPTISSINPIGGGAGTTVTISGTGYAAGATVSVGDAQLGTAQATKVTVVDPTQITAVVPPGRSLSNNEATMVNVQVTVAGHTSKAILFSYCSNVTEFDPTRKECVPLPPTCGSNCPPGCPAPLVFSTAQNKCVPQPPTGRLELPAGSYQLSCINILYDPSSGLLTAQCTYNNSHVGTVLYAPACNPGADIANISGVLQCQALAGTWGQGGAVPNGSYQKSCAAWKVLPYSVPSGIYAGTYPAIVNGVQVAHALAATCNTFSNGQTNNIILDLTDCIMGQDIANIKGTLECAKTIPSSRVP
jgi:IPT/TIG domain